VMTRSGRCATTCDKILTEGERKRSKTKDIIAFPKGSGRRVPARRSARRTPPPGAAAR
jgi:hypothetical protein